MAYDQIIISILISTIITLIIFILGHVYNIKLKAIDYEIIRKTYLLENCYGVLKAYFDMVHPILIANSVGTTDRVLAAKLDNYKKISMTYSRYYFEINKADEKLAKMIHFFVYEIDRDRVKKEIYLKKLSKLGTNTIKDPINEETTGDIRIAMETEFDEWITFLRNRIESIYEKYSKNLKKYIEMRKQTRKIVILPFIKID